MKLTVMSINKIVLFEKKKQKSHGEYRKVCKNKEKSVLIKNNFALKKACEKGKFRFKMKILK